MAQRNIDWQLFIAWDGTNYDNETSRLVNAQGSYELTAPA